MLGFRVWDWDIEEEIWIPKDFDPYQFGPYLSSIESGYEWFAMNQSTGLMDCKDKEIFEGDILIIDRGIASHSIVVKEVKDFLINWNNIRKSGVIVIIGNIYENPELLEKIK